MYPSTWNGASCGTALFYMSVEAWMNAWTLSCGNTLAHLLTATALIHSFFLFVNQHLAHHELTLLPMAFSCSMSLLSWDCYIRTCRVTVHLVFTVLGQLRLLRCELQVPQVVQALQQALRYCQLPVSGRGMQRFCAVQTCLARTTYCHRPFSGTQHFDRADRICSHCG